MIISFIRFAVRAAARSSPRSSPVKDTKERGITLRLYNDASLKHLFDFGIGSSSKDRKMGIDEEGREVEICDPDESDEEENEEEASTALER